MKEVDTAKKRRIITWIIILIVLFILLTGLCLFIFSDMILSALNMSVPCCSSTNAEEVECKGSMRCKESMERMERAKSAEDMGGVELKAKNMDSDDLGEAMEKMESNRW